MFWVAPFAITWFRYLKTLNLSAMKNVIVDQMLGFPACYAGFIYFQSLLNSRKIREAHERFKQRYTSVILQGWTVWIPAQTLNFLIVPFYLRILYIQSVSLLWQSYLSFLTNSKTKQQ